MMLMTSPAPVRQVLAPDFVWIHFYSRFDATTRDVVLESLAACGLTPDPMGTPPYGYGIVGCHGIDRDALNTVQNASRSARVLVLVVGVPGANSHDLWTVMAAG